MADLSYLERAAPEVLCKIIGYLPFRDVLTMRTLNSSFHQSVTQLMSRRLSYQLDLNHERPLRFRHFSPSAQTLVDSNATFEHFRIASSCVVSSNTDRQVIFYEKLSSAKSVVIHKQTVSLAFVRKVLQVASESLEDLTFSEECLVRIVDRRMCDVFTPQEDKPLSLPNLRSFTWVGHPERASDAMIAHVLRASPRLRSLSLSRVEIRSCKSSYEELYPVEPSPPYDNLREDKLTVHMLLKLITFFCPGLEALDLSKTAVGSEFVEALLDHGFQFRLKELNLDHCNTLRTEDAEKILRSFEKLTRLKLLVKQGRVTRKFRLNVRSVSSNNLSTVGFNMDGLPCNTIRDVLSSSQKLKTLLVMNPNGNLSLPVGLQLTTVRLTDIQWLQSNEWVKVMAALQPACGNLRTLAISGSGLKDNVVRSAFSFTRLRALKVACGVVTDNAFVGVDYDWNTRGHDVNMRRAFQDLVESGPVHPGLMNLRELVVLDLAGCGRVSDLTIIHSLDHPELEFLGLSGTKVTDEGLRVMPQKVPNLIEVRLLQSGVNEVGVQQLLRDMNYLKRVQFNMFRLTEVPRPVRFLQGDSHDAVHMKCFEN